jgi:hypothetical protein
VKRRSKWQSWQVLPPAKVRVVIEHPALGLSAIVAIISAGMCCATFAAIAAASCHKAMLAPAVSVALTGPRARPEEDTAAKISWPVKSVRRTRVRRAVIVSLWADRWDTAANADDELCRRASRYGTPCKQCCCGHQGVESAHALTP